MTSSRLQLPEQRQSSWGGSNLIKLSIHSTRVDEICDAFVRAISGGHDMSFLLLRLLPCLLPALGHSLPVSPSLLSICFPSTCTCSRACTQCYLAFNSQHFTLCHYNNIEFYWNKMPIWTLKRWDVTDGGLRAVGSLQQHLRDTVHNLSAPATPHTHRHACGTISLVLALT